MLWLTLAIGLGGAGTATASPDAALPIVLSVPYLPQTEALCGAAAAAMTFRYWGEAHADVQSFKALVDRKAGGIATDVLASAIEARGWRTARVDPTLAAVRDHVSARRPVIVLLEDRPERYHYVVVIGWDAEGFVLHDPAWGPSRRMRAPEFAQRWEQARSWSLTVLPALAQDLAQQVAQDLGPADPAHPARPAQSPCDRLLAGAVDDIRDRGPASADAVLGRVRAQCPDAAGPLRELAGVRFAERRWSDAADLAAAAVARDPTDQYAWEVLASSRFMLGDESDALRAWNAIGQPRVDDVQIHGLSRTRYALIAEALGLTTGEVLTSERLRRARRKLELLPDQSLARVGYRPAADGFATVDVTMMERPTRPIGIAGWVMNGARTAIERELDVAVPGGTGQGELWTGSWRWWEARPRAALAFTTPRFGGLPGVWRVDASWEAQSYRPDPDAARVREVRTHGGLTMSDWLTADLRYELRAGLDAWSGGRRAVSVGGTLERRFLGDDAAVTADVDRFVGAGVSFQAAGVHARFRSSSSAEGFVYLAGGGIETASDAAPFALWPGAGDGHGRSPLVRAHSLLEDGVVTGAVFGRRLVDGSTELQRWFETRLPIRVGAAVFIDMARASRRPSADATAWVVDAGGGFRAKVPGLRGVLRIDYARGLRDGAHALTFGWQY